MKRPSAHQLLALLSSVLRNAMPKCDLTGTMTREQEHQSDSSLLKTPAVVEGLTLEIHSQKGEIITEMTCILRKKNRLK